MNKYLKCLSVFIILVIGTVSISFVVGSLFDWFVEVFSEKTVMIGGSIISLGILAFFTRAICKD